MTDGDGSGRVVTYAEGATLLGMQVESFKRLAFRRRWHRTAGNDGLARVTLPAEAIALRLSRSSSDGATPDNESGAANGATPDSSPDAIGTALTEILNELRDTHARLSAALIDAAHAKGELAVTKTILADAQRMATKAQDRQYAVEAALRETEARLAEYRALPAWRRLFFRP